MSWIVGGNYSNGSYAGLAYTDMVTKAMAENLQSTFLLQACNQTQVNDPQENDKNGVDNIVDRKEEYGTIKV